MIILPTRQRLLSKRNALYLRLYTNIGILSYKQVEDIMRQIHGINLHLRIYFSKQETQEAKEIFDDENHVIKTQDTPTLEELLEIEKHLKEGEV